MNIRGLQRFSLVDFPGKMACIVFVGNCNFRCPYCHNPCLIFDPESQPLITEDQFFRFLDSRVGKLDGVVISGGEPSLRPGLAKFVSAIKAKGFLVKIDTNSSNPEKIIKIHHDYGIDALGIDYKAPLEKYNSVAMCASPGLGEKVHRMITFAHDNNIPVDVRTTVHKCLLEVNDLKVMREELNDLDHDEWILQQFNPIEVIDDKLLEYETYSDLELVAIAKQLGKRTRVRGLKGVILQDRQK